MTRLVRNNNYSPKQHSEVLEWKKFTINASKYKITKRYFENICALYRSTTVNHTVWSVHLRRKLFEIKGIPFRTEICSKKCNFKYCYSILNCQLGQLNTSNYINSLSMQNSFQQNVNMETLFAQTKESNMARMSQHRSEHKQEKKGTIAWRAQQQNQEIWFTWLPYQ